MKFSSHSRYNVGVSHEWRGIIVAAKRLSNKAPQKHCSDSESLATMRPILLVRESNLAALAMSSTTT